MSWWTMSSIIMILVHLCRALDLKCTQSGSGKQVISSVDTSLLPGNESTCSFSWANGSVVLAHNSDQVALVTKKSLGSLQTSECCTELNWEAHCTSEETSLLVFYTANCTSSCEQNELLLQDKGGYSALYALLLIPVLLLGCLLYKYRKKTCSTPNCSQCGGLYTSVKTQNIPLETVDVTVER